jgi:hypothetical protein
MESYVCQLDTEGSSNLGAGLNTAEQDQLYELPDFHQLCCIGSKAANII